MKNTLRWQTFTLALTLSVTALAVPIGSVSAADPLISAFIGTQTDTSKLGYLVLDFAGGPAPQSYAFGWHYEGSQTNQDFLLALEAELTGPNGFEQEGAEINFVTLLGFDGKSRFNDFGGNNSGDPNGFWRLWLGFNGTDWTPAQFGAAGVTLSDTPVFTFNSFTGQNELSGAKWHAWRWVSDFTSQEISDLPPSTPFAAAVTPEPAGWALMALGITCATTGGWLVRRKRG